MTKKIINLVLVFTSFTITSCYDNSNEDHTDVEVSGPVNTNDTSGSVKGNDLDTTGVNYSKVKK
jgi:hypothetical protein